MFVEKANNHENKIQNGRYQVTYDFTIVKWKTADLKKRGYAGHDTIARSIY